MVLALAVSAAVAQPAVPVPVIESRFSPGGGCEREVAQQIDRARTTLDIAIYCLNEPTITRAILAAHKRGVRVRVVADTTEAAIKSATIGELERAKVPVHRQRGTGNGVMHLKVWIIDRKVGLAGSFNGTVPATCRNDEVLMTIRDHDTIEKLAGKFEQLWRRQP